MAQSVWEHVSDKAMTSADGPMFFAMIPVEQIPLLVLDVLIRALQQDQHYTDRDPSLRDAGWQHNFALPN